MPTVADPRVSALRRLELILDAIRVLEAERPFGERVEDALRLAVGTGVAHAAGVAGAGAPCHVSGVALDAHVARAAEDAAGRAAREGRGEARELDGLHLLALPLRAEGLIEGGLWLVGRDGREPDAALASALADRLARAAGAERRRREQLDQAQRLRRGDALKTALLRGVTHELRSPLAAIASAADALRVVEDRRERDEMLQAVISETRRMERVVSNLLDLSRVEGGVLAARMEWCVPEELVGAALQAGEGFLDGVEVVTDVPDGPLVRADPVLTERILVNLLHNAVRHGAPPVRVNGRTSGTELVLSVEDAGPGVDPVVLPAVFEPFIHREGVGLGLGLPLCQRLAGAQGARLEHRVGALGGAAFDLVLPLSPAPALEP
jgi:two-component system sensor histidine kinase KdpD